MTDRRRVMGGSEGKWVPFSQLNVGDLIQGVKWKPIQNTDYWRMIVDYEGNNNYIYIKVPGTEDKWN